MRLMLSYVSVLSCLILMCACNPSNKSTSAGSVSAAGASVPLPSGGLSSGLLQVQTSTQEILALGSLVEESLEDDKNLLLLNNSDNAIKLEMNAIKSTSSSTIAIKGYDIIEEAKKTIDCEASGSSECI